MDFLLWSAATPSTRPLSVAPLIDPGRDHSLAVWKRCLKRRAKARRSEEATRVVGIDDWAWRKASTYGTIVVDLERREELDLFPERAAGMTADWLKRHPDIEIISRDRCGSFAQGAQEGAPQARQIADRFHILQNLREAIQAQLGRVVGISARPLLPADGEEVARVRDKHGVAEHRSPHQSGE